MAHLICNATHLRRPTQRSSQHQHCISNCVMHGCLRNALTSSVQSHRYHYAGAFHVEYLSPSKYTMLCKIRHKISPEFCPSCNMVYTSLTPYTKHCIVIQLSEIHCLIASWYQRKYCRRYHPFSKGLMNHFSTTFTLNLVHHPNIPFTARSGARLSPTVVHHSI